MPIDRPFFRTARQFLHSTYSGGGKSEYTEDPRYAIAPEHYVRSFLLLLKDLRDLFDHVEPADSNQGCYSFRIHALLLRACVEVESNCKAVLHENGYVGSGRWNMADYKKIEKTHRLSSFKIVIPHWKGSDHTRVPFAAWKSGSALPWYEAYNASKHNRHEEFERATFGHLLDAVCGLLAFLSAQFITNDFTGEVHWVHGLQADGTQRGIGGFFRVGFPDDWPPGECYDFDWNALKMQADPFRRFDYSTI